MKFNAWTWNLILAASFQYDINYTIKSRKNILVNAGALIIFYGSLILFLEMLYKYTDLSLFLK